MSWGDDILDTPRPAPDPRQRLTALVSTLDAEEVPLALLLVAQLVSQRPQPGQLSVPVPRDAAGTVSETLQSVCTAALASAGALLAMRGRLT